MLVSWLSLFLTVLKFSLQNKTFVLIKNSVNSSLTLFITFSLLYSWGIISSHCNGWNWNWQSKLCHFTIQSFARWTNCLWQYSYDACQLDNTQAGPDSNTAILACVICRRVSERWETITYHNHLPFFVISKIFVNSLLVSPKNTHFRIIPKQQQHKTDTKTVSW